MAIMSHITCRALMYNECFTSKSLDICTYFTEIRNCEEKK